MPSIKMKISSYLFAILVLCCCLANAAYAGRTAANMRDSSIKWDDAEQRMKLLESAPGWDSKTMQSVFAFYHDAAGNQLPVSMQSKLYNIEFINAMWGPANNPFVKYARPAKVFISFGTSSAFYIAPLVKNETDGNFYIFDKEQDQPMLLGDWVNRLASKHGGISDLLFNVCDGYANDLTDSCSTKSYQDETYDAMSNETTSHHLRAISKQGLLSSRREMNEDWQSKVRASNLAARSGGGSIYDNSIDWKNGNDKTSLLDSVAAWSNYKVIQQNFEKIRDIRYFDDNMVKGFVRRISWLYPDDGCWTRASAVIKDLFGPHHNVVNQYQRPSKIFAFGNLCVNTSHSSTGYVSWWYHTAPVIRDAESKQVYVLDPAVEPRKPLTVDQWMSAIAANSGNCRSHNSNYVSRFAICNGYGTNPGSRCDSSFMEEESTELMQPDFQGRERQRQVELGRNADAVLGDTPPWLN